MKFKIGFVYNSDNVTRNEKDIHEQHETAPPRKSVVQVRFPGRSTTLAYYNDMFDLHPGDLVYVDGKLEGKQGRIIEVNYNFKIKISEYKRVTAVVDTDVKGKFYYAGSHFVTFDANAIPVSKIAAWFKAPAKADDEFISSNDDSSFCMEKIGDMKVSAAVAERGNDYYLDNKVRYISVDGTHGYAIVEGSEAYEVEFEYRSGKISNLVCSCFCSYNCKHEVAAMLQLRETLDLIEKHYMAQYESAGYFAAVLKGTLFSFAVDTKETGSFTLG